MSYILDALKKSEAEHDPAAAIDLALNQQSNQSRQRTTGVLIAAALLANVAALIWLFGPNTTVNEPTRTPAPEPVSTSSEDPLQIQVVTPQAETASQSAREPAAVPSVQPDARIRTPLANLPAAARKRFPGLVFSTHIWADDPGLRAVVANGRRLVEGDEIDGVAVHRITENGVILSFENYLVEIPVVAEWQ
ncbi:MAG: general secretion pathway protein GspB [Pseudomonadales bacterium]